MLVITINHMFLPADGVKARGVYRSANSRGKPGGWSLCEYPQNEAWEFTPVEWTDADGSQLKRFPILIVQGMPESVSVNVDTAGSDFCHALHIDKWYVANLIKQAKEVTEQYWPQPPADEQESIRSDAAVTPPGAMPIPTGPNLA